MSVRSTRRIFLRRGVWLPVLIAACTPPPAASRRLPSLIEFYADWWERCLRVKPVVRRLEAEFVGRVAFQQLDIDDPANDAAKRLYRFRAQPQVVIVDRDGRIAITRLSQLTYPVLRADLQQVLDG